MYKIDNQLSMKENQKWKIILKMVEWVINYNLNQDQVLMLIKDIQVMNLKIFILQVFNNNKNLNKIILLNNKNNNLNKDNLNKNH